MKVIKSLLLVTVLGTANGACNFTQEELASFRESRYAQQRLMKDLDWSGLEATDQKYLYDILLEPCTPSDWLELMNCSAVADEHFIDGNPDGDQKRIYLSSLHHLSISGCPNLTARCIDKILSKSKGLRYLDISRTSLDEKSITDQGELHIKLPAVKTLKMNGLRVAGCRKIKTIRVVNSPQLEVLECDGADGLSEIILMEGDKSLEYISLENAIAMTDDALDLLLFKKAKQDEFGIDKKLLHKKDELVPRFSNLKKLNLKGTSVTWPEVRGMLPTLTTEKIKEIQRRLKDINNVEALNILKNFVINHRRFVDFNDFFRHTGHWMKNVLGGVVWDVIGLIDLFRKKHVLSSFSSYAPASVESGSSIETVSSSLGLATDVTGVAGGAISFLTRAAATVPGIVDTSSRGLLMASKGITAGGAVSATGTTISAATIASGVGVAISGGIWIGRAAYWEHQRINQEIELTQIIGGKILKAAIEKIQTAEASQTEQKGHIINLDLSRKGLGDSGIKHLLMAPDPHTERYVFNSEIRTIDLSNNDITDVGGKILLSALNENDRITQLVLAGNHITDEILGRIQTNLNNNAALQRDSKNANDIDAFLVEQLTGLREFTTHSRVTSQSPSKYFGLSIDGGGMRGIIPAVILKEIYELTKINGSKMQLHKLFDCIGGVSVGGIGALCLSMPHHRLVGEDSPLEPNELIKLFYDEGKQIFGQKRFIGYSGRVISRYSSDGLASITKKYFGDQHLSAALTHTMITGVRTDTAGLEPFVFDSKKANQDSHSKYDFYAKDVAQATASAPTYFPPAYVRDLSNQRNLYSFWDGGIWQNNPSQLVFNRLLQENHQATGDQVLIFSIGTGRCNPKYDPVWTSGLIGNFSPLIFGQMELSQNGVTQTMQDHLGNNYIRLQPSVVDIEKDMDDYNHTTLDLYKMRAKEYWRTYSASFDIEEKIRIIRSALDER